MQTEQNQTKSTENISAAAAEAPTKPEEEKKVEEVEAGANLTELFVKLDDGVPSDAIESLCMDCRQMGVTKFMYTKIPMFKEIIISSFVCGNEECGFKNNEV